MSKFPCTTLQQAIHEDPEIRAETPCFRGARVPVKSLSSAVVRGRTVHEFMPNFPSVTPEQVETVLLAAANPVHPSTRTS